MVAAGEQRGAMQCLGTHLEGPLDASTSPVRQHSAAGAGCCRVNVQYHGARKCPEQLRAGRHSPGQTRRLRRFQRFCWKFGTGGTPAGACCHCVLKACKVCIARAWQSFRRCQRIRINNTYWETELGWKREKRKIKTAGEEILRQRLTCGCEFSFFFSKAKDEKPRTWFW